jgi:hypothetical protein
MGRMKNNTRASLLSCAPLITFSVFRLPSQKPRGWCKFSDFVPQPDVRFPIQLGRSPSHRRGRLRAMKSGSRRQGSMAAVGSVRRPLSGRTGMSETRRKRPFLDLDQAGSTLAAICCSRISERLGFVCQHSVVRNATKLLFLIERSSTIWQKCPQPADSPPFSPRM